MRHGPLTLDEMKVFAAHFAQGLEKGDAVLLYGTLGAGKTTFAAALIQSLVGRDVDVTSPTFSLLHTYDGPSFIIHHFDLYRLKNESELDALGFDECLHDGLTLIEWPDIALKRLRGRVIKVKIDFCDSGRMLEIT